MNDIIKNLSEREQKTVNECLVAAAFGNFFPDWEFQTLFGVNRDKVKAVAEKWPTFETIDEETASIIVNSMNHLLGYPHGQNQEWENYITVPRDTVKRTLNKLLELGI